MTDPTPQPDPAAVLPDAEVSAALDYIVRLASGHEWADPQMVLEAKCIVAARTADSAARLGAVEDALAGLEEEVRRLYHVEDDPRGAGRVAGAIHAVRAALSATAPDAGQSGGDRR